MDGRNHGERIQQRAEHEQHDEERDVRTIAEPANPGSPARVEQLQARRAHRNRDVVVRARLHAVQAERAVDVADFGGQVQPQLATSLHDQVRRLRRSAPGDAVRRPARLAGRRVPDPQLERRHGRRNEIELPNRTQMLAERPALENQIDCQRRAKVCEDQIRGAARQRPEIEELVGEQHRGEKNDGDPLAAKALRPQPRWRVKAPAPIPNEHERAAGAEEVAGGEERDDEQAAVVHPGEDRCEVAGRDVWTEETVQNDDRGGNEEGELQGSAGVTPLEQPADERPTENIYVRTLTSSDRHQFPH